MHTYETIQLQKVKEIAFRNGWSFIEELSTKYSAKLVTQKNVYFLIGAELGLNNSGASRVCNDKAFTQYFLSLDQLQTIPTKVIFGNELNVNVDFPAIVKPNMGWGGKRSLSCF
jgi:glutathione synthase/RimK-type ligase-like ATP-grasp enzyme